MKLSKTKKFSLVIGAIVATTLIPISIFFFVHHSNEPFRKSGTVILNDNLSSDQRIFIENALQNTEVNQDLTISANTLQNLEHDDQRILYNILVPTTDFYNPISNISSEEIENYNLIPILQLTAKQKLLSIDKQYYLDTFNSGAVFEYLTLTGNQEDIVKITTRLQEQLPSFPTKETVTTLAQTGVTALSRGMNTKLHEVGDATYFAQNITPFLKNFDFIHTSNESSFSTLANDHNICSAPQMVNALITAGFNIIELTGNHNQDCGDQAALDTLAKYNELGIKTVGGGATATLASEPLILNQKNNQITLLAYNLSTGGYTLDDTPGANLYTKEKAISDITAAKTRGDTIIIDIQYYECNSYNNKSDSRTCDYANSSAGDQIGLFRELIDLGANIVIGTSAHQPQTYELYNNGAIYYGLGNLFFDQVWWPGTTRSLILVHYFFNNQLVQTRIVPTIYDPTMQTRLMDTPNATNFLERLNQARP